MTATANEKTRTNVYLDTEMKKKRKRSLNSMVWDLVMRLISF